MTFSPINVVNGTTPANATWGNNAQLQYQEASLSFNPDLFTAGFVLSGFVATKDGVTANLLDVTAGTAYVLQSADNTVRQRKLTSSTQTTSALSSTYHLWLQPDGTWYWSTSNAPAANSLHICDVTTDGSGNILTVTDQRVQAAYLFNAQNANTGAAGLPAMVVLHQLGLDASALGAGFTGTVLYYDPLKAVAYNSPAHGGSAIGHYFATWDGTTTFTPLSLGGQFAAASTWIGKTGNVGAVAGQATAGSYGVASIVGQSLAFSVSATTLQTLITFTVPANGFYRVNVHISASNGIASSAIACTVNYHDPHLVPAQTAAIIVPSGNSAVTLNGVNTFNASSGLALAGATSALAMSTAAAVTITYQDPSGTPNDVVNVLIERLA